MAFIDVGITHHSVWADFATFAFEALIIKALAAAVVVVIDRFYLK